MTLHDPGRSRGADEPSRAPFIDAAQVMHRYKEAHPEPEEREASPEDTPLPVPSERWISRKGDREMAPDVDAFLMDVLGVCRRHRLSIGHEDCHGAFQVEDWSSGYEGWLWAADDDRDDQAEGKS